MAPLAGPSFRVYVESIEMARLAAGLKASPDEKLECIHTETLPGDTGHLRQGTTSARCEPLATSSRAAENQQKPHPNLALKCHGTAPSGRQMAPTPSDRLNCSRPARRSPLPPNSCSVN